MVVIIGGGIAGAATAFYLTKISPSFSVPITIIDAVGKTNDTGASSSGSGAGAFLAESWGDGTKTEILHKSSFRMHVELAEELELSSFRFLPAFGVDMEERQQNATENHYVPWLSGVDHSPLPGRNAQVDPGELTGALLDRALEKGAKLVVGSVESLDIETSDDDDKSDRTVTAVRLKGGEVIPVMDGDKIVFTLGPWSSQLEDWLSLPMPIEGVWSTSLVFDNYPNALFADYPAALFCKEDSNGCHLEVIPRPPNDNNKNNGNSLYVSGCGGSKILSPATLRANIPSPSETNQPDISRSLAAQKSLASLFGMTGVSSSTTATTEQRPQSSAASVDVRACIRPVSPDSAPIIGKVHGFDNAFVGTGGGPWGITWAPVMGLSIARLIKDNCDPPINIRNFLLRRFDTPVYQTLLRQRGKQANEILMGRYSGED